MGVEALIFHGKSADGAESKRGGVTTGEREGQKYGGVVRGECEGLGKGGRQKGKRDRYHEKRLSSDRRTGLVRDLYGACMGRVWGLYPLGTSDYTLHTLYSSFSGGSQASRRWHCWAAGLLGMLRGQYLWPTDCVAPAESISWIAARARKSIITHHIGPSATKTTLCFEIHPTIPRRHIAPAC